MTKKEFASQADREEKQISFVKLAEGAYAYTAEGDPNAGVYQCAEQGVKAGKSLKQVYDDTRRELDPTYRQVFILRALHSLRCQPRVRRSQRHQSPAHLDGRAGSSDVAITRGGVT